MVASRSSAHTHQRQPWLRESTRERLDMARVGSRAGGGKVRRDESSLPPRPHRRQRLVGEKPHRRRVAHFLRAAAAFGGGASHRCTTQRVISSNANAASRRPLGEKATDSAPGSASTSSPVATSHSFTSPTWPRLKSIDVVASRLPSGENATPPTSASCPRSRRGVTVLRSQSSTSGRSTACAPLPVPAARYFPSGPK